jgi:hypothetical protein
MMMALLTSMMLQCCGQSASDFGTARMFDLAVFPVAQSGNSTILEPAYVG